MIMIMELIRRRRRLDGFPERLVNFDFVDSDELKNCGNEDEIVKKQKLNH